MIETGMLCRICGIPLQRHPQCPCGALIGDDHRVGLGLTTVEGRPYARLWHDRRRQRDFILCSEHIEAGVAALQTLARSQSEEDCPICGARSKGHPKCGLCGVLVGGWYVNGKPKIIHTSDSPDDFIQSEHIGGKVHRVGQYILCEDHAKLYKTPTQIVKAKRKDKDTKFEYQRMPMAEEPVSRWYLPDAKHLLVIPPELKPAHLVTCMEASRKLLCSTQTVRDRVKDSKVLPAAIMRNSSGSRAFLYNYEDLARVVLAKRKKEAAVL